MKYKISDIAEINKKNINKNYKGKVFYLDTSSVTNDFFNCPKIYTSLKEAPIRARRLAEDGDTIISTVRPAMRHVGYISQNLNRVYSTGFAIISPKKSKVNPFYLYLVLSSKEITNLLQSIAVGSTSAYPSIKPRDIGNLIFDFPSLCIQEKIASIMQQIILKIKMNNQINDNLMEQLENEFNDLFFKSFPSNFLVLSSLVIKTIAGDWGKTTLQKNFDTKTTIIRGTDFQDITMGRSSNAPTRYVKKKNLINKELQQSDVVVEISGGSPTQSTGRSLLITNEIKNSFKLPILGTNFTRTFKTENLENAILLKSYLQFLYLKRLFFNYENGTTGIKNLDYKNVLNIKLPDVRTNKLFKNYIKKYILFYKFIIKLGKQNKTLESIKDAFLKLYF